MWALGRRMSTTKPICVPLYLQRSANTQRSRRTRRYLNRRTNRHVFWWRSSAIVEEKLLHIINFCYVFRPTHDTTDTWHIVTFIAHMYSDVIKHWQRRRVNRPRVFYAKFMTYLGVYVILVTTKHSSERKSLTRTSAPRNACSRIGKSLANQICQQSNCHYRGIGSKLVQL